MAACQIQLGGIGNGFDSEKKPAYYTHDIVGMHVSGLPKAGQVVQRSLF
jgi:hypothetical protein